jgi:hypothetical protein
LESILSHDTQKFPTENTEEDQFVLCLLSVFVSLLFAIVLLDGARRGGGMAGLEVMKGVSGNGRRGGGFLEGGRKVMRYGVHMTSMA